MEDRSDLRYAILDPTGNITALVESPVAVSRQPEVAAGIMARHPQVEQVGFLTAVSQDGEPGRSALRMAGGEFCGNAAMSAAALVLLSESPGTTGDRVQPDGESTPETVCLQVSGAERPVEVRLWRETENRFRAGVRMPPAKEISKESFSWEDNRGQLPVVWMEGISHIVIEPDSPFWALRRDKASAEAAVRDWCDRLSADGLGLMFYEDSPSARRLTPLVYVPGSGTVFWENSCASGTSAAGMYLAEKNGGPVDLTMEEPGGVLRVESDPARGETWLYGRAKLVERYGARRETEGGVSL